MTDKPGGSPYRVVLMARVSTPKQGDKPMSLPEQYTICREYATGRGWDVVAEFEDKASGMKWDRPGLLAAIDLAKRGLIDGVLAINHDRLCRANDVRGWFKIELRRHGARIHYATIPDEADTPVDQLIDTTMSGVAEYVRSTFVVNSTKGRAARVREGKILHNGFAPFGYKLSKDKTAYEPNDTEVPWLVEIFERYANGQSPEKIARWLNSTPGAPKPRKSETEKWVRSSIARILEREDYTGRGTRLDWEMPVDDHGRPLKKFPVKTGEGVVLKFPEVIDGTLWVRVREMQAEASHRTSMNRADTDPDAGLLRGAGRIICAGCEEPMAYEKARMSKSRPMLARYRCRRTGCTSRASYHQEPVDETVWAITRRIVMDERYFEDRYQASLDTGELDKAVDQATAAVAELNKKRGNLQRRVVEAVGDDLLYETLKEPLRHVETQWRAAREHETTLLQQRARTGKDAERLRDLGTWLVQHREGFESLGMAGRRRLLALAGIQVRVAKIGYGKHVAVLTGGFLSTVRVTSAILDLDPDEHRALAEGTIDPRRREELARQVLAARATVGWSLSDLPPAEPNALQDVAFDTGP